ncbi:MAG TPA: RteC domain-containing protein [Chitinophagaceae bacterium]|nr:RteC domain-containing protein [Chitinophagaceae bacterium]
MKEKIQLLYRQMLTDLERCWHSELTDLEKIEKCFRIAIKCWYRLRDEFAGSAFESTEAEIDFFKNLKPLFTGRIEFYTIAYKSILFKPEERSRLKAFWKEEFKKLQTFRKNNEEFINYYKSGDTSLDGLYFLRVEDGMPHNLQEVGAELRSSHDYLISAIHAQELYHKFVAEQLKMLSEE